MWVGSLHGYCQLSLSLSLSLRTHTQDGHLISYLPLSHIAAQMTDIISQLTVGHTVWFAQPDALKGSLAVTLKVKHIVFS